MGTGPREKGLEVRNAPLHQLGRDAEARPVVPSCPPQVPMPHLFADAWQRDDGGDVPGYEELTTNRYRRR